MIHIKLTNAVVCASYQRRVSSCLSFHCRKCSALLYVCIPQSIGKELFISWDTLFMAQCMGKHMYGFLSSRLLPVQLSLRPKDGLTQVSEEQCENTDCTSPSPCVICGDFMFTPCQVYILLAMSLMEMLCFGSALH